MLINLRNALMAGKRLPYDAEVEYLESTGDQYIDTGYKFVFGDTIRATFAPTTAVGSTTVYFFGADTAYNVGLNSHYDPPLSYDGIRAVYGNVGRAFILSPIVEYTPGTIYTCEFTPSARKINNSLNTATVNNPGAANYTVVLFAARRNATIRPVSTGFAVTERFFSFSVERNGVKILDLIPVRKKTVGYLYDRVSGKLFGNAGTGDFVLGQDVVPVEYIESHGTEYIDTGVYLTGNHSVEIDFQLTSNSQARKGIFGGLSISRYGALLSPSNNSLEFGYGSNNVFYQITPDTLRHLAKQQKNLLYLDGVLIYTFNEAAFTSNFSAPLGNFNYTNYAPAQAKYYLSKWYDGDTPIRSFRPVRVGAGSTWEGAMMDVLTRRIYRNAGTGAFAYGNDLKYPIPAE